MKSISSTFYPSTVLNDSINLTPALLFLPYFELVTAKETQFGMLRVGLKLEHISIGKMLWFKATSAQ
jgi:hypothetical protein